LRKSRGTLPFEAADAGIEPARGILRPRLPYQLLPQALPRLRAADGAQDREPAHLWQTLVPQRFAGSL
jgi:hypothetical protein